MTKSELIHRLARRFPELKVQDADASVNVILGRISTTLAAGDRAEIRGFGSFDVSDRPAHFARNPKSGERVEVPAKRVVRYKAGKELREAVITASRTGETSPPF
jgi:integration host factor subunit beta